MFLGPGWPTHPCLQVLFCVFGCVVEAKGTLSKDVFEQRTSTGSEAFSLFICLDANKLVLLSFFSLLKTIYPRVSSKPLPNDAKSPLPVDVRRSKRCCLSSLFSISSRDTCRANFRVVACLTNGIRI